jgi:hypothetical protein
LDHYRQLLEEIRDHLEQDPVPGWSPELDEWLHELEGIRPEQRKAHLVRTRKMLVSSDAVRTSTDENLRKLAKRLDDEIARQLASAPPEPDAPKALARVAMKKRAQPAAVEERGTALRHDPRLTPPPMAAVKLAPEPKRTETPATKAEKPAPKKPPASTADVHSKPTVVMQAVRPESPPAAKEPAARKPEPKPTPAVAAPPKVEEELVIVRGAAMMDMLQPPPAPKEAAFDPTHESTPAPTAAPTAEEEPIIMRGIDMMDMIQPQPVSDPLKEAAVAFKQARSGLACNDLAKAESGCKRALTLDPENAEYLALSAWVAAVKPEAKQGLVQTELLIEKLDRAIRVDPKCERAYFYRGMLRKRLERTQGAIEDFRRALELKPASDDVPRELRLLERRNDAPEERGGLLGKLFKK